MIPELTAVPMPPRVARLARDHRGYPIPAFVAYVDGKPSFPVASIPFWHRALKERLCWVCGDKLGRHLAFAVGPMCCVNRVSSEPPSHFDCAAYAAQVCPFLVRPHMRRLPPGPEPRIKPAGVPVERNPGAVAVWVTRSYTTVQAERGNRGTLLHMGPPERVEWFAEGRPAPLETARAAFELGVGLLRQFAAEHGDDMAFFEREAARARHLVGLSEDLAA